MPEMRNGHNPVQSESPVGEPVTLAFYSCVACPVWCSFEGVPNRMVALPPPSELLAILSGWLAAAFGWIKWWYELVEKRREKVAKEKAEAALAEIRRRATDSRSEERRVGKE